MKKRKIPKAFYLSLTLFLLSLSALAIARLSPRVADVINQYIGAPIRRLFAAITNPLPFSLAELIVVLALPILALLIFLGVRAVSRGAGVRYICRLASFVMIYFTLYSVTLGVPYHASPINEKMGFDMREVTEDGLYTLAEELIEELNTQAPLIVYSDGASVMPYTPSELSEKICEAYDAFLEDYPIFENMQSSVKRVGVGELMASAGLLGIYTYFTGEANVSFAYPDYCIPETVAHELAHQRGVAREDEANFIAYLVCSYSSDPYIKYSGVFGITEYIISAVSQTNKERAAELYTHMHEGVISDINTYREFYLDHMNSPLRKIARSFNDAYLKANGTSGVVSYSEVVKLYVSYSERTKAPTP